MHLDAWNKTIARSNNILHGPYHKKKANYETSNHGTTASTGRKEGKLGTWDLGTRAKDETRHSKERNISIKLGRRHKKGFGERVVDEKRFDTARARSRS